MLTVVAVTFFVVKGTISLLLMLGVYRGVRGRRSRQLVDSNGEQ